MIICVDFIWINRIIRGFHSTNRKRMSESVFIETFVWAMLWLIRLLKLLRKLISWLAATVRLAVWIVSRCVQEVDLWVFRGSFENRMEAVVVDYNAWGSSTAWHGMDGASPKQTIKSSGINFPSQRKPSNDLLTVIFFTFSTHNSHSYKRCNNIKNGWIVFDAKHTQTNFNNFPFKEWNIIQIWDRLSSKKEAKTTKESNPNDVHESGVMNGIWELCIYCLTIRTTKIYSRCLSEAREFCNG